MGIDITLYSRKWLHNEENQILLEPVFHGKIRYDVEAGEDPIERLFDSRVSDGFSVMGIQYGATYEIGPNTIDEILNECENLISDPNTDQKDKEDYEYFVEQVADYKKKHSDTWDSLWFDFRID